MAPWMVEHHLLLGWCDAATLRQLGCCSHDLRRSAAVEACKRMPRSILPAVSTHLRGSEWARQSTVLWLVENLLHVPRNRLSVLVADGPALARFGLTSTDMAGVPFMGIFEGPSDPSSHITFFRSDVVRQALVRHGSVPAIMRASRPEGGSAKTRKRSRSRSGSSSGGSSGGSSRRCVRPWKRARA